MKKIFTGFYLFCFVILNLACNEVEKQPAGEEKLKTEKPIPIPESTQLIIAHSNKLYGLSYQNSTWQVTFDTIPCSIGKNGFAAFDQKVEGDGKSPSGKFSIGASFGYEKDVETDLEFIVLQDHHYWVSDTSSEFYNQLIEYDPKDRFSEKMRRKDHLYKYGIVIEYNTQNVQKGKGSAIFLHVERRPGSPTLGCVAISEANIKRLLQWLKPNQKPQIIMGNQKLVQQILKEMN